MIITKVIAREIFDSRAIPTVSCDIHLENGLMFTASVPCGASRGKKEAFELRDGGKRLQGLGVLKAVHNIEHSIAPLIIGKEADVVEIDAILRSIDTSSDKHIMGENALLAVSIAVCKAQAKVHNLEPYELLAELIDADSVSLPFPLINIINGGVHANNNLPIQEFLLAPMGFQNFRTAFEASVEVAYILKEMLNKNGKSIATGDEGGFAPCFDDEKEPFEYIMEALLKAGVKDSFSLAIDVAANQFYDSAKNIYNWNGSVLSVENLIEKYKNWSRDYALFSIEDGCAETDIQGWKMLSYELAETVQLVGDDIFVTNKNAIERGIREGIANAAIIKPNQRGTITETLEVIAFCQEQSVNAIVSHRSGETEDTFIADLAVGTGAGQIKVGGCFHGERIAKYNRLLQIEDLLMLSSLDF